MINIAFAQLLSSLILIIIAYFISVAINSVIQVWVAEKLGDTSARDSGFLTVNHYDFVRLLLLLIYHVGLSRTMPINAGFVQHKHKLIKLFGMYIVETVVSFILGTIALIGAGLIAGGAATLGLLGNMYLSREIPLKIATLALPETSSLSIILLLFLITIAFLNVYIAMFSLIVNGFKYAMTLGFERNYKYIEYADTIVLLGSFFAIFFLGDFVGRKLLEGMIRLAYTVSYMIWGAF